MQVLSDSSPFGQTCFEAEIQPGRQLMHAESVKGENRARACQYERHAEPPGLSNSRVAGEREDSFVAVPDAVRITGHYPKPVRTRREVCVYGVAGRHGGAPVGIEFVEP